MRVAAPRPTWLDLHWRMFGASFRVHVLFWLAAAALGWAWHAGPNTWGYFVQSPEGSSPTTTWGYVLLWIPCILVSLVVHEIGHVLAARYLGGHPESCLYLLGSITVGLEEIKERWKRIVILWSGPLATGLFLFFVWALANWATFERWVSPGGVALIGNTLLYLAWFNTYWLLLNLIPLWPLDVGRVLGELGDIGGKQGRAAVLGVCLFTATMLALWMGRLLQIYLTLWRMTSLFDVNKDRFESKVKGCAILLFFLVLFLAKTFMALRAESQPLPGEEPPTGPRS